MSLLCAYSDSSSASGSDDEQDDTPPQHATASSVSSTALPGVDDLFASNSSSVLNTSTAPRFPSSIVTGHNGDLNKRRSRLSDLRGADAKRLRGSDGGAAPPTSTSAKPAPRQAKPFAPPQLKRPNVSTEDTGAWNTQTTMRHHERKQKGSE